MYSNLLCKKQVLMLTLPLSEPVAPHALMAPARRVMSHEYGSTQFDTKFRCRGSYRLSVNHTLPSKFHRHRFFVSINTCYRAFQKGKEKRKKKKREFEETAANCLKF